MPVERADLVLALALAASLGTACATPPSLRVRADVLDKITIENKLLLFDAENELNIAIDARDQVVDEIARLKEDARRARKKGQVAERDEQVFSDKGDAERARLAVLRGQAAEAQLEYLDARLEWARERLDKERRQLIVAKAKFELAKAKLVKKNNVPGASSIDLADFEAQVSEYAEDVGDSEAEIKEAEATMKDAEAQWVAATGALRDASGGALGSRWLE